MAVIGELITKLSAETSSFTTAMTEAAAKTDVTAKSMLAAATSGPVLAGAVVAVGAALVGMVAHAAESADQLIRLQAISGLTYTNLQELQFIASQTSVSFESLTNASAMMTRNMGQSAATGGDLEARMQALGIATVDATGAARSQNDVFNDTITALAKVGPGMEQSAAGAAIFGRGFRELLPLLAEGEAGIDRMRVRAHELGAVMSGESIAALDDFGDTMSQLKTSVGGAGNSIAISLLPELKGLVGIMQNLVIPVITTGARWFASIEGNIEQLGEAIGRTFPTWARGLNITTTATVANAGASSGAASAALSHASAAGAVTDALGRETAATKTSTFALYAKARALREVQDAQESMFAAIYEGAASEFDLAPSIYTPQREGPMRAGLASSGSGIQQASARVAGVAAGGLDAAFRNWGGRGLSDASGRPINVTTNIYGSVGVDDIGAQIVKEMRNQGVGP